MGTRLHRLGLLAAAITLALSAPAAAQHPAKLPVGVAEGVRVVKERGAIVVIFSVRAAKLYRRVAGKRVVIDCVRVEEGLGSTSFGSGGLPQRAPKRRRPIRRRAYALPETPKLETGDGSNGIAYCRVWLAAHSVRRDGKRVRRPRELIVSVPVSQLGALRLDKEAKAPRIARVIRLAAAHAAKRARGYPTHDNLLDSRTRLRLGIVPLSGPGDTPPAGRVGYWGDGGRHMVAAMLSAAGERMFVEWQADVFHTNVAEFLAGPGEP